MSNLSLSKIYPCWEAGYSYSYRWQVRFSNSRFWSCHFSLRELITALNSYQWPCQWFLNRVSRAIHLHRSPRTALWLRIDCTQTVFSCSRVPQRWSRRPLERCQSAPSRVRLCFQFPWYASFHCLSGHRQGSSHCSLRNTRGSDSSCKFRIFHPAMNPYRRLCRIGTTSAQSSACWESIMTLHNSSCSDLSALYQHEV